MPVWRWSRSWAGLRSGRAGRFSIPDQSALSVPHGTAMPARARREAPRRLDAPARSASCELHLLRHDVAIAGRVAGPAADDVAAPPASVHHGVSVGPGETQLTRTPCGRTPPTAPSWVEGGLRGRVSTFIGAGCRARPSHVDDVPPRSSAGQRGPAGAPRRLNSRIARQCASSRVRKPSCGSRSPGGGPPALFEDVDAAVRLDRAGDHLAPERPGPSGRRDVEDAEFGSGARRGDDVSLVAACERRRGRCPWKRR